jgi:hypothetical protein
MSIRVSPTFSASNTRACGIRPCTTAAVVVLPAPWVPLSHTIMGPDDNAATVVEGALRYGGGMGCSACMNIRAAA